MKRDGRSSRRPIGHSGRPQRARVRAIRVNGRCARRVNGRCARRRASSNARHKQASRPQRRHGSHRRSHDGRPLRRADRRIPPCGDRPRKRRRRLRRPESRVDPEPAGRKRLSSSSACTSSSILCLSAPRRAGLTPFHDAPDQPFSCLSGDERGLNAWRAQGGIGHQPLAQIWLEAIAATSIGA
jgi:hypothetical protein